MLRAPGEIFSGIIGDRRGRWGKVGQARGKHQGKKPGAGLSRRDFSRLGGAGLAGAALLGAAGCGGGGSGSGGLTISWGPDDTGSLQALIKQFNKQSDFKVNYQEMPVDTGQYFFRLQASGLVFRRARDPVGRLC